MPYDWSRTIAAIAKFLHLCCCFAICVQHSLLTTVQILNELCVIVNKLNHFVKTMYDGYVLLFDKNCME